MKRYRTDVTLWLMIILFLIILFTIYNQQTEDRYKDVEPNAPNPENLDPVVSEKMDTVIEKAANIGIDVVIIETVRSNDEQQDLYQQGRSEEGNIVTHSKGGESYHNYGLAVDYALRNESGDIIWDTTYDGNGNGDSDWFEVADIAKESGFEWGGDWSGFKDYPHLQIDFGLSIRQLKKGLRPSHNNNDSS